MRPKPQLSPAYATVLENFEKYLKVGGFGNAYYSPINIFLNYCQNSKIDFSKINYNEVNGFILYLQNKKYNSGYINNFIKALRRFYNFLTDSENLDGTLITMILKFKLLKEERKIRERVTPVQFKKLISNAITFAKGEEYLKNRAVLYFLFYTGVRASELINIKREDIDLEKHQAIIRVPTKNKQERYVYFTKRVSLALKRYFIHEPQTRNAFNTDYTSLSNLIKSARKYMFKDKKITAHSFRYGFADLLAENNIGVKIAQKLLGHKSIDSTLLYYDPNDSIVKKSYDQIDQIADNQTKEKRRTNAKSKKHESWKIVSE